MQNVKVDITPGYEQSKIIYVSQYDVGREFKINLTDGTDGYTIPAQTVAKIAGIKPSGLGFQVQGTISGNQVTFTTTSGMTDEAGRIPVEISLTKGTTILGSKNFYLDIEEATHHPETPDGSKEFTIPELTLILQQLSQANAEAETNIGVMTSLKNAAEAAKIAAEAAEEAAEEAVDDARAAYTLQGNVTVTVRENGKVRVTFTKED